MQNHKMDDFKKRLLEFIEYQYGFSVRKFEEMCGVTNGTVGSIKIKGPSTEVLYKISDKCPDLNLNWLITGKGNMLLSPSGQTNNGNNCHNFQNNNGDAELWRKLCEEKDKRIAELERTIQILLKNGQ